MDCACRMVESEGNEDIDYSTLRKRGSTIFMREVSFGFFMFGLQIILANDGRLNQSLLKFWNDKSINVEIMNTNLKKRSDALSLLEVGAPISMLQLNAFFESKEKERKCNIVIP